MHLKSNLRGLQRGGGRKFSADGLPRISIQATIAFVQGSSMIMIGNAQGGNQDYVKIRAPDMWHYRSRLFQNSWKKTNPNLILFLQYWASLLIRYVVFKQKCKIKQKCFIFCRLSFFLRLLVFIYPHYSTAALHTLSFSTLIIFCPILIFTCQLLLPKNKPNSVSETSWKWMF